MIERVYYSLEQAAEILPYSRDDLLHMGANGELDIAVLVGGHAITKKTVIDNTGSEVAVSFGAFPGAVVKIERKCIQSHEAGLPARVTLVIYYGLDGGNSEVLTIVDPMEEDGDLMKAGDFMMKDAKLVIMAADLKRLQESKPQTEDVKNTDVDDVVTDPSTINGEIYPHRKTHFNILIKDKTINLNSMKDEEIYNLVIATKNAAWANRRESSKTGLSKSFISQATFERDFFSTYRQEIGLIRGRGPKGKKEINAGIAG